MLPPTVCVIGKKNSGKTTLTVKLLAELNGRGWRALSAKHGHGFDLDTPGTDSWKHSAKGGAARTALVGPTSMAVLGDWGPDGEPDLADVVERFLSDADVVVAEGFKSSRFPRIEVFRTEAHAEPVFHPSIDSPERWLAMVTDEPAMPVPCPVFDLHEPALVIRLADLIEREVMNRSGTGSAVRAGTEEAQ